MLRRLLVAVGLALALTPGIAGAQLPVPLPGEEPPPSEGSPPPPPPVVEPPPPGSVSIGAGVDRARSGSSGDASLQPPFGIAWTADVGAVTATPVLADGRVILLTYTGREASVVGLDAASGNRLWSAPLGTGPAGTLAYDDGRVFTLHGRDRGLAFDAATGRRLWDVEVDDGAGGGAVAGGGMLYVQGQSVTALDAATGAVRWMRKMEDGTNGEPALAGDRLYAAGNCTVVALDRRDGRLIWRRDRGCQGGGGGSRVVLWRDRVLPEEERFGARAAGDGAPLPGFVPKLVNGDIGVATERYRTASHDLASGRELWAMTRVSDGLLGLPGALVASDREEVVAYAAATGAIVWSGKFADFGHPPDGTSRTSLAAGQGLFVIARGRTLVALAGAPRARPEPLTLDLSGSRNRRVLDDISLDGRTGERLRARVVRLEADRFPFDRRWTTRATEGTGLQGEYGFSTEIDRNTRLRVVAEDGRVASAGTIRAYPRFAFGRVRQAGGRVTAPVRVRVSKDVSLRRRRVAIYLLRAKQQRIVRLDASRLNRRGRATFRFRPLARLGRKDAIVTCLVGAPRLGFGARDVLAVRCGRRVVRF